MDLITATIITRNEESNLERCLNALQGVADEIVVVDSYSTDRTLDICRHYGCKVTQREFQGFGSQRQYATGLASNTYILSIDADEVIDEEMRSYLIKCKNEGFKHRVYAAHILNYFCGRPIRHSGYKPVWQVRLFNRRYANWNLRDFSDQVAFPDSVNPEPLPGTIHHYRCASIDEFKRKENRLAALKAKVIAATNSSIGPFTPHAHAVIQYFKAHILDLSFLDGNNGAAIASRRSRTAFEAYRMARHIIKENKNK
ncbi:MAG: glycosyltransferase family 2 protein [Odoribacter sp.]|nr:glycosyltransferase family 2 protein [Odoribacter sp.]